MKEKHKVADQKSFRNGISLHLQQTIDFNCIYWVKERLTQFSKKMNNVGKGKEFDKLTLFASFRGKWFPAISIAVAK